MAKGKNKNKKKNTAPAQNASTSKAAEPKPVEPETVESKPVEEEEPTPAPVATPTQISATLALPEEPTPAKPLVLGKSANSSTMDLKDAMKMSPTTEEPAAKEDPIVPKKSVESLRKSLSIAKESEPESEPEIKVPEQEKAKEIPQPPTMETLQETMKDQTPSQPEIPAPATVPYVSPSTEASSSRPPTGVQDIHTDVADVKLPEPAHTSAPKKNEIETLDNEESNRPTTSSSSAGGKAPSAIGTAVNAAGRSSTAEEREPKKGDKKEGGFKGLWGRIVSAFK
ncbi:hypothetical protein TWF569_009081 [Orbilia oligospora]|uniref:Uncharacterized protein n=1 Tax=Orbilia oligospora TaxID=2813651 RepID=A0A7C8JAI8_ORBOL|nr:hypothetical protein TWF102_009789 [Orbilia oligospora]KAF3110089.1 hypothetical protein TWF103_004909 [Orbilia oligospora]KAF3137996.1 hypothetical protein TWF569_009081 [Orbilia oligospora]KAF3153211.1 hypothetical protein TWF594_000242 [Orbilia oligospora]